MAIVGGTLVFLEGREASAPAVVAAEPESRGAQSEAFAPLVAGVELAPRKLELGRRLFHDPGLSGDGSVSCAHCHNLGTGGVDRLPRSLGIGGREGAINAPTVFNSGLNFRQFWDGHAASLEEQIDGPLLNPLEMGGNWPALLAALGADPGYRAEFQALYPDGLVAASVRDAIASFERSLQTPNSRFDQFLRGDSGALNAQELAGFRLFQQIGCSSCHQGRNIGGNLYQKLGVMDDYFGQRGPLTAADMGRFNSTHREEDRHFFKVPSLRNVALTAPYLHDGSVKTLEEVVQVMTRYQLGREIGAADLARIVAFLRTLTRQYQGRLLE
jgi:cytochrome c peroxidase